MGFTNIVLQNVFNTSVVLFLFSLSFHDCLDPPHIENITLIKSTAHQLNNGSKIITSLYHDRKKGSSFIHHYTVHPTTEIPNSIESAIEDTTNRHTTIDIYAENPKSEYGNLGTPITPYHVPYDNEDRNANEVYGPEDPKPPVIKRKDGKSSTQIATPAESIPNNEVYPDQHGDLPIPDHTKIIKIDPYRPGNNYPEEDIASLDTTEEDPTTETTPKPSTYTVKPRKSTTVPIKTKALKPIHPVVTPHIIEVHPNSDPKTKPKGRSNQKSKPEIKATKEKKESSGSVSAYIVIAVIVLLLIIVIGVFCAATYLQRRSGRNQMSFQMLDMQVRNLMEEEENESAQ